MNKSMAHGIDSTGVCPFGVGHDYLVFAHMHRVTSKIAVGNELEK